MREKPSPDVKTIYIALSTKNLKEYAKKSSHRSKNVIK